MQTSRPEDSAALVVRLLRASNERYTEAQILATSTQVHICETTIASPYTVSGATPVLGRPIKFFIETLDSCETPNGGDICDRCDITRHVSSCAAALRQHEPQPQRSTFNIQPSLCTSRLAFLGLISHALPYHVEYMVWAVKLLLRRQHTYGPLHAVGRT